MKNTQAWGWLAAGVLALGLNGIYQDGGAAWARRAANHVMGEISDRTGGVLALATGRADWFLAKTQAVMAQDEVPSCPWAAAIARWQTRRVRGGVDMARVEAVSAREEAQMERWEANRARVDARVAAEMARMRVMAASFNPVVCRRVQVSIPRVQISVPGVHVDTVSLGSE